MKLCGFEVGLDKPFFLIAGPCVIESMQLQLDVAGRLQEITGKLGIPYRHIDPLKIDLKSVTQVMSSDYAQRRGSVELFCAVSGIEQAMGQIDPTNLEAMQEAQVTAERLQELAALETDYVRPGEHCRLVAARPGF